MGIRRYLSSYAADYVANILGTVVMCAGHSWYVISDAVRTDVLDLDDELWTQWALGAGTAFPLKYSFPYTSATGTRNLFITSTSLAVFNFDANQYQDNAVNFTVTIITDNEEFETLLQKNMSRLIIWGDVPTAQTFVNISWSDTDYQSFTSPIAVDMFVDLPQITQLGSFRHRIFKLTHSDNFPLRLKHLECEINKGQN
jgi:hypothetical protein